MKDFFTQCMKDLFALTGIEQVRWMQNDLKDGKRNFDLCVEGMVHVSKQFSYIPDPDQQKIVRRMMMEDKDYTSLNGRVVYKWFSMFKDVYWTDQTHFQEGKKLTYGEYLNKCLKDNIPPLPQDAWDKPVSTEQIQGFLAELNQRFTQPVATIDGITDPQVALLKEQIGTNQTPEDKALRTRYIAGNYNSDGSKKDCWSSFDEWLSVVEALRPGGESELMPGVTKN